MRNLELTDEEHAALLRLVEQAINTDRYPLSPRLPEKLEPSAPCEPRPVPKVYAPPKATAKTETTRWALSL
jgi:hypothetical protein